jgi:uridine phosphorylase
MSTKKQYHIHCSPGDVGRIVLMPGDPGRVPLIAKHLDGAKEVARNREYLVYTGSLFGAAVTVCSTGIGGPSTAIAVEELARCGSDTFIRVGTSGIMQERILPGDLVVATGAIRDEGTSSQYLPLGFPAVADAEVVSALRRACIGRKIRHHYGVVHSKDSFYGETEPDRMPISGKLRDNWSAWVAGGSLCSEMEAATMFIVSATLGLRSGALLLAGAHDGLEELCATAVDGVRALLQSED